MSNPPILETPDRLVDVSVVLVWDLDAELDQRIWNTTRALGRAGYRAEILLVDPNNRDLPRVTYRPVPNRYPTIASAIEHARFQQLAIIDADVEVRTADWITLANLDEESIRTSAEFQKKSSPSKRFWLALLTLIIRVLLKTKRHPFTRGITLLRKNQVRPVLDQLHAASPGETVTRLLAMTRQLGQPATELITYRPGVCSESPSSSQIRKSIRHAVRFWFNVLMFPKHQSELIGNKPKSAPRHLATIGLLLLAALLLFGSLDYPFLEPDEARNAQLALNLQRSSDWSVLKLNDQYYWDKPPLQMWAIAVSHKLFGASTWSTRFPVALASLLGVMATLLVGQRLVGFRAAAIGTLCLLLTGGFLLLSRYTTMDASLTAAVTATMLFGLLSIRGGFRKHLAVLAGTCAGIGMLTKGPVIVILTLPPLLLAHWLGKEYRRKPARLNQLAWYLIPALLIAGPWFVSTCLIHPEFLTEFFWKHNIVRFANGFNHQQPFYFYLLGIFLFMFPVSYLFPSAIRFLTSRQDSQRLLRSRETGWLLLFVAWNLLFFSLSTSKLPTYIAPAFPAICLLLGVFIEQKVFLYPDRERRFLQQLVKRAPIELPAWCLVITLVALLWVGLPTGVAIVANLLAVALGGIAWYAQRTMPERRARRVSWIAFASVAGILGLMVNHYIFPAIAAHRSDHLAVRQLESQLQKTDVQKIVFIGRDPFAADIQLRDSQSIVYFPMDEMEQAVEYLLADPERVVVASREPMELLKEYLVGQVRFEKCSTGRHVYRGHAATSIASSTADRIRR